MAFRTKCVGGGSSCAPPARLRALVGVSLSAGARVTYEAGWILRQMRGEVIGKYGDYVQMVEPE